MAPHNTFPVGQVDCRPALRVWVAGTVKYGTFRAGVQGDAPPLALSSQPGQLPSANRETAFLYQHTQQRTHKLLPHDAMSSAVPSAPHWTACHSSPTLLQPRDPLVTHGWF